MTADRRNLLQVLKAELNFLEQGGYGQHTPWRPPFFFEDSPTCLNFHRSSSRYPCSQCALTNLVPLESRSADLPCRHIPLDDLGETLASLYRTGTQQEIASALDKWLRAKIKELEEEACNAGKGQCTCEIRDCSHLLTAG